MNTIKCGNCKLFDPILGPHEKPKRHGQCIPRSKYPAVEGPGQVFPAGVARVAVGQRAEPFVVRREQLVEACEYAQPAEIDAAAQKVAQQAQIRVRRNGKLVLE